MHTQREGQSLRHVQSKCVGVCMRKCVERVNAGYVRRGETDSDNGVHGESSKI